MITRIDISDFRGIAKAELDGLTPLTVLTGPNACGKSAVLDALLMGVTGGTPLFMGLAVQRHPEVPGGAHWLVRAGSRFARLAVTVGGERSVFDVVRDEFREDRSEIGVEVRRPLASGSWTTLSTCTFNIDNDVVHQVGKGSPTLAGAFTLVDPALPVRLSTAYARAVRAGFEEEIATIVRSVVPGFQRFVSIEGFDEKVELHLVIDGQHPVPLNMSGDGIISLVQIAVQLAPVGVGVALIEEPEVCQHPSALRGTAQAIAQAVRRGTQVVLTTHSVEFIDHLVLALGDAAIHEISVHNLSRTDGVIVQGVLTGEQVRDARMEFGVDPR